MRRALKRRVPTNSGVWEEARVIHAPSSGRLAPLDVSHEGHQPVLSAGSRHVSAFDCEIYNPECVGSWKIEDTLPGQFSSPSHAGSY
jgi:asparagine synthetase B (glutamine-hydrolysing)